MYTAENRQMNKNARLSGMIERMFELILLV